MDSDSDERRLKYSDLHVDLFQLGWKAAEKYGHKFGLPEARFCKEPHITVDLLRESISSKLNELYLYSDEYEVYNEDRIRDGVPIFIKNMEEGNGHTPLAFTEDFLVHLGMNSYCMVLQNTEQIDDETLRPFYVGDELTGIFRGTISRIKMSCFKNPVDLWDKFTRLIKVSNIGNFTAPEHLDSSGGQFYKSITVNLIS